MLDRLRPGLKAHRVRPLLREIGLPMTESLEALYGWRDGTTTDGVRSLDEIHLFPGFYFLSLEDAIANYQALVADLRWRPGWLPLFANGGGDFYVTDLSNESPGAIRHFRIEESEHPVEFLSVRNMVSTLAAAFERGVFFVDANGSLEMDDAAFASVAAELNRGVPWWAD